MYIQLSAGLRTWFCVKKKAAGPLIWAQRVTLRAVEIILAFLFTWRIHGIFPSQILFGKMGLNIMLLARWVRKARQGLKYIACITAATMTIMTSVCFYNIITINLHFRGIQDEGYLEWRHGRSQQLHLSNIYLSPFISLQNNNTSTRFLNFLEGVWICRILIIVI